MIFKLYNNLKNLIFEIKKFFQEIITMYVYFYLDSFNIINIINYQEKICLENKNMFGCLKILKIDFLNI